jgi:hypothetical protein
LAHAAASQYRPLQSRIQSEFKNILDTNHSKVSEAENFSNTAYFAGIG